MGDGDDFRATVRRGAKASQPTIVTHVLPGTGGPTSVGFVVSRAVGGAVDRNRVKRRLRHLVRERLHTLPPGSRVVVRALPPAADACGDVLADHLEHALEAALARAGAR